MAQSAVRLAKWEIVEILDALRLAGEDGQYDDDAARAASVEKLQAKLRRAIARAD